MSFTVSLLEIFAYLLPGGLILATIVYVSNPLVTDRILSSVPLQVAFLVGSYIIGHLLTQVSIILAYARMGLKWIGIIKKREKRLSFHKELHEKLKAIFGSKMTKADSYYYSLRLIAENHQHTGQTIDRLYALTLFSRNTSFAFFIIAMILINQNIVCSLLLVATSFLFFIRYIQLEKSNSDTVLRAAYVYLCTKDIEREIKKNADSKLIINK
jgi:predicted membrane protein